MGHAQSSPRMWSLWEGAGGNQGPLPGSSSGSPCPAGRGGCDGDWLRGSGVQGARSACATPQPAENRLRAHAYSEESWGRRGWLRLVPVGPPGLGSGLGCLQSCIVPWEPLEHFACLILPVHYLAVIPTEDILGGRQGARLAGRTPTPPPSRELGGGQGLSSLQCDRCDYEG